MNEADVLAVVVNWNGAEYICSCLDSIISQNYPHIRTVVVDNGSTDGSLDLIKKKDQEITLIENRKNLGYCKGLNQGIDASESEFLLCLNTDVKLQAHFVETAIKTMREFPQCGMLSGKILRFDGKTFDSTGQFIRRDRRPRERGYGEADDGRYDRREIVFSVCGAVAFYRRKMLDRLRLHGQYFDEDYFAFNEDLDLGWRAQLQGWQCVYEPGAVAYHQRGATGQTPLLLKGRQFARRSAATRYHIIKNRYMTMLKNDSAESLLADAACIIGYDILLWSYTVLTSPAVVLRLPVMVREILLSLSKRRVIQSSRCVDFRSIREAIA